ncbi:chemotaxis protein CheC [uncultured Methanomethylovorans sp.]|uniref:chemotaxis protein CheC n=1 Tax=uncultured Methanomethylovorans sp. TaxID=183759 RepID=UPI002AA7E8CB|nr:chemotaxis protein CheC [uncultured Methanomethylovorans sp.]
MAQLSGFQSDALQEIGGIGMGNAATALSKILNSRVQLNLSNAQIIDIKSMSQMVPSSMTLAAVLMDLRGDLIGTMMLLFDFNSAATLSSVLISGTTHEEDPGMYESALNEMGNILTGSYLKSIYEFLGAKVIQSPPTILLGDAEKVFNEIENRLKGASADVLNIETMFQVQGLCSPQGNCTLYGDMFLFLNNDSLGSLLSFIDKLVNAQ